MKKFRAGVISLVIRVSLAAAVIPISDDPNTAELRVAVAVCGVVQGVGFRPFVYNLARRLELVGWVRNEATHVRIEVQGARQAIEAFVSALRGELPPQARIEELVSSELPVVAGERAFVIQPSGAAGPPSPTIPADLATCAACLAEINTSGERRHRYPFTNCTNCGPRWSIIAGLPYDRPRTAMRGFTMCPACRAEYENPADRRFHAQPIACPACGPQLSVVGRPDEADSLGFAVATILEGGIVALKGLGGFQLLADATNETAVAELRRRKRRPDKPFAVMLPTLDDVRRRCHVGDVEAAALVSPAAPILLLRRRADAEAITDLAAAVAPGNPYLGVMLPYTPLHHLLMNDVDRPVICTSGNLAEEPMAITTEEAIARLGAIADVIVTHDRPIVRPVDDSVARVGAAGLQVLRRARGFAPLPIDLRGLDHEPPPVLAVGGHLKNVVALNVGRQVLCSAHIGDLDTVLSVEVFHRAIDDLINFFQVKPAAVACDLHPDYASTRYAERLAARWNVPLVRVQHHHAHAAACMAEHGIGGPLLALSWDGTGYGVDGTIWGGEVLRCERDRYERFAALRPFPLPGGDRAAREPRRSALGLLYEAFGPDARRYAEKWFAGVELDTIMHALQRGLNAPRTSSMGRLFDAVAALCGLGTTISFEGQAAMALEFAADEAEAVAYPLSLRAFGAAPADTSPRFVLDWQPLLEAVLADRAAGVPVGRISARFHNALADAAVAVADAAGCKIVALTGGCFQNARLTETIRLRLLQRDYKVIMNRVVPPGDGGIALGQLCVAVLGLRS